MKPPPKPLLIYDGDCGFCRMWIDRWKRMTGAAVDYAPSQTAAARFPDVDPERFAQAVQLIEPDGTWTEGAEAVFRTLAATRHGGGWLWAYRRVPGFRATSELAYRVIARQRPLMSGLTRGLWGRHVVPPGEAFTSWLFLRLLGLVFAVAFASLWTQIIGLAGERGILPAVDYVKLAWEQRGAEALWIVPSVFWIAPSDAMLHAMCAAGMASALMLMVGLAPVAAVIGCWSLYLSLASIGQNFLWFQWDGLLLEAGFLALFVAPWTAWSRPRDRIQPSRLGVWLLRWLLFRLMVASALVKISSGDPTWANLTALDFHYFTQPLPPWTAWFAHQLPPVVQKGSIAAMFVIEGLVPLLFFTPRRLRIGAALVLAGLQLTIVATGNYGFFNLLSLVLCVMLLDDGVWPTRAVAAAAAPQRSGSWPRALLYPLAPLLIAASLVPLIGAAFPAAKLGPIDALYRFVSPLRTVNRYGLFAVMTTERPEIIVEGSDDGAHWLPYAFRWKPGALDRRPEFVAPHMPRLDWQMWFAALRDYRNTSWFLSFGRRLLEASPPVLALLAHDPFEGRPPRFVRARVFDYRFSLPANRETSGVWWARDPRALYCPILTLRDGGLAAVPNDAEGNVARTRDE